MDGLCVFQGIFLRTEYILSTIPKEGSQSVKFRVYLSYRKGIPSSSFYSLERVKSWWKAHMGVPISLFCPQVTISSSLFFLLSLSPSSGEYLKLNKSILSTMCRTWCSESAIQGHSDRAHVPKELGVRCKKRRHK